jgi:hypothetical protein
MPVSLFVRHRFHGFGDMFVICDKEDLNACIDPFVRMKGSDG